MPDMTKLNPIQQLYTFIMKVGSREVIAVAIAMFFCWENLDNASADPNLRIYALLGLVVSAMTLVAIIGWKHWVDKKYPGTPPTP